MYDFTWGELTLKNYQAVKQAFKQHDKLGHSVTLDTCVVKDNLGTTTFSITTEKNDGKAFIRVGVYDFSAFPELAFEEYMMLPFDEKFPKDAAEIKYLLKRSMVDVVIARNYRLQNKNKG